MVFIGFRPWSLDLIAVDCDVIMAERTYLSRDAHFVSTRKQRDMYFIHIQYLFLKVFF
jgi:hypothetical protein